MDSSSDDWMHCTLCRAGRESARTLRKAQRREVEWTEPNIGLVNPLQDQVVYTSLDDAFANMMQFMRISTRKCGRYHNSHKPHSVGSESSKHTLRYHSPSLRPATITNPVTRPSLVQVDTAPGTYSITATKWTQQQQQTPATTHVVRVQSGQSISLTLSV